MKVELITHTPDPEKLVAAAARLCYSASEIDDLFKNMTDEKAESLIKRLQSMGHESPFEHITFTFAVEDVSRVLLAQLTRHRLASYSVQSMRYVHDDFGYVTPDAIRDDEWCDKYYKYAMDASFEAYRTLSHHLQNKYMKAGINEKTAEKMAIEDARYVLPNATCTKIIFTMNARSLFNFFSHRCCERAQKEIRDMADAMLLLVKDVAPTVFRNAGAPCVRGKCPEGALSCGRPKKGVR